MPVFSPRWHSREQQGRVCSAIAPSRRCDEGQCPEHAPQAPGWHRCAQVRKGSIGEEGAQRAGGWFVLKRGEKIMKEPGNSSTLGVGAAPSRQHRVKPWELPWQLMQLLAHSFNNAGLFSECNSTTNKRTLLKGKALAPTTRNPPPFISAPGRRRRSRQRAAKANTQRSASLSPSPGKGGNLRSRFHISASISASLPLPTRGSLGPKRLFSCS